MAKEAFIF